MQKNHLAFAFILSLVVIAFIDTWISLSDLWLKFDYAYSHGYLALLLAGMHLFHQKHLLNFPSDRASVMGLIALVGASLLWMLAAFLNVRIVAQLLLPVIIGCVVFALYGFNTARKLTPVYLYILFSIPVWNYLNSSLQSMTAWAASTFLEFTGLAVFIEGNFITIPYGTFEVAGGCSGLRYLMCSLVLVLFYSQQRANAWVTSVKLFYVAIVFAILANWIRVILIILIGYESEMQSSIVKDHDMFGWYVYIGTFTPAMFLLNRIERAGQSRQAHPVPTQSAETVTPLRAGSMIMTIFALVTGPALLKLHSAMAPDASLTYSTATTLPAYSGARLPISPDWAPLYKGAVHTPPQYFKHESHIISFHALYYLKQAQGFELVSDDNVIADPEVWTVKPVNTLVSLPTVTTTQAHIISKGRSDRRLVFSFYRVNERNLSSELLVKLAQLGSIVNPKMYQGLFSYSIPCANDCVAESKSLAAFVDIHASSVTIVKNAQDNGSQQ